jgi:uncharacterized protein
MRTLVARHLAIYFTLVGALTIPFWLLGQRIQWNLLPGLPIAALAVAVPAGTAILLSLGEGRTGAARAFLVRAISARGIRKWMVPALVLNPVLFATAFAIARLRGDEIPDPVVSLASGAAMLLMFVPAALLEEIGWSGYALPRLQALMSPLAAALALGFVWALWHLPALLQVGRSPEWIGWWCVWTVAARVIMVWLYNWSGGSVLSVAACHAVSNLCWQVYPVNGSHFDPQLSALVTLVPAGLLAFASAAMRAGKAGR